jgi:aromatic-amino-acid transaminase
MQEAAHFSTAPSALRELRHELQRQAERGAAPENAERALAELMQHADRLADAGLTAFVANSFSKSMSLYGERAGALSVVCETADEAERVLGQMKATVRRNYSSPAIHAAGIVSRVLGDAALRAAWEADVAAMRTRIQAMRRSLHDVLGTKRPGRDFGYFLSQRGMFSYTGLSAAQVDRLRDEFGVYLVRSGRICVAGLNNGNVERTAAAIAAVL